MINLLKKIDYKKIFIFFLLIILISQIFKLPYNLYLVKNRDYDFRMMLGHGYCDKDSYGFITETLKQFKIKDRFPEKKFYYPTPGLEGLLKKSDIKLDINYLFLLNFSETETNNLDDLKKTSLNVNGSEIYLSDYSLMKRNGLCSFWIKND